MNKLEEYYFTKKKPLLLNKWHHYFKIYDKHFKRYQGKSPVILEIGVASGGSLVMWNDYFDGDCTVYGIDVNPNSKIAIDNLNNKNFHVFIGNQEDPTFLNKIIKELPDIDIVIDDGGHHSPQQRISFEHLYEKVKSDGIYFVEDLHTSYWGEYRDGGLKNPQSFIEYSKNFIDKLNAYYIINNPVTSEAMVYPNLNKNIKRVYDVAFRKITHSITYYDSIVVFEKMLDNNPPISSVQYPNGKYTMLY